MRELVIAGRRIADDTDAFVICEIGHNHGGSLESAMRMIDAAARAGASAVKLQKRNNRALYTEDAYGKPYESEHSFGRTYGEHREALEFSPLEHWALASRAKAQGLVYFITPFDAASAAQFSPASYVSPPCFKIASADVINLPLLREVAGYQRPVILSTGASSEQEVDRAVNTIAAINPQLAILQCTAEYPVRVEHLHLNVISTYRQRYPEFVIGLSSHYSGISDAIAAYVLGARIIEKHFTLDRTSKGSDHAFSLEPAGFAKMVSYLRNARAMLGSGDKRVLPEEQGMIEKMRKTTRWYQELGA